MTREGAPGKHGAGDPAAWRMKRQTAGNRGAQSYGGYGGKQIPSAKPARLPNLNFSESVLSKGEMRNGKNT